MAASLPEGSRLVRTTAVFTDETVPPGLQRAHRIAEGVWGRLVVHEGMLGFVFEDEPDHIVDVRAGEALVIPPGRLHHVEVDGRVRFAVEFHEPAGA